jgi:ferric-dicitrate binding protein FerR (iron transport regulator)
MTMSDPISDAVMARFLAEEASPAEIAVVEAWVADSPANALELSRLRAAFEPRGGAGSWDVDRAWTAVSARIAGGETEAEVIPIRAARGWPAAILRLAAAVIVVVGVFFAWQAMRTPGAPTTYASGSGERLEIPLPDGSLAVLAPSSTLSVPADYEDRREVTLAGEAWFDVGHDDANQFVVNVAGFEVRDVGTVFTIDGRRPATVVVTVVEGEVLVHHGSGELEDHSLTPGQVGRFTSPAFGRAGRAAVASDQPVAALTSWNTGSLDLVNVTVGEALARLSAWYGMPFTLADTSLLGRLITATLPLDSLDEASGVLSLLVGTEAIRDSTGVIFR